VCWKYPLCYYSSQRTFHHIFFHSTKPRLTNLNTCFILQTHLATFGLISRSITVTDNKEPKSTKIKKLRISVWTFIAKKCPLERIIFEPVKRLCDCPISDYNVSERSLSFTSCVDSGSPSPCLQLGLWYRTSSPALYSDVVASRPLHQGGDRSIRSPGCWR